jgi:8-oxo-dGTP pyrophosphatase MutT (NUDIX family)
MPRPRRREASAGGVIVRRVNGEIQLCVIMRQRQRPVRVAAASAASGEQVWCLPKGHIEAGEDPAVAALREVREETGLVTLPRGALGDIEYWFAERARRVRIHKQVHHFLFEAVGGSLEGHDHEIGEARWFDAADALRALQYTNERTILERAIQATAPLGHGREEGETQEERAS